MGVALRVADGAVTRARVAVGSIAETPELVPAAAAGLAGAPADEAGITAAARATAPGAFAGLDAVDDLNGAADYKRHLAGGLLEQAARAALREAIAHA